MCWELARESLIGRKIRLKSNSFDFGGLKFIYKNRILTIFEHEQIICTTDGNFYVNIRELKFRTERSRLRLQGLFSEEISLLFDWDMKSESDLVLVSLGDIARKIFLVKRVSTFYLTKLKLDMIDTSEVIDSNTIIGCLAFLWMYCENERIHCA